MITRYFFDTEFMEDGETLDLLSIGMVADDGREFYAEVAGVDYSKANAWVEQHVLPHLWSRQPDKREGNRWIRDGGRGGLFSRQQIARELETFCDPREHGTPEFWTYYGAYDWVALCQLFGPMNKLPEGWPMYAHDLKSWQHLLGLTYPEQSSQEHHALQDARWNQQAWTTIRQQLDQRTDGQLAVGLAERFPYGPR